jgi:hypothetical protein
MSGTMDDDKIVLDPEAQALFEQFGGMESWKKELADAKGSDRLAQSLLAEQKRLDAVRILLIQMACLVSRYLADEGFADRSTTESEVFLKLGRVLTQLSQLAHHVGGVFIRYRGTPADPDLPDKYDYEVVIGNTGVDNHMAPRVTQRSGLAASRLPEQLLKAFTIFAEYGVNNIFVQIADNLEHQLPSIQLCFKILSGFRKARHSGAPILVGAPQKELTVPLINDENLFPDPNLTLMAGLNQLGPKAMGLLVEKVDLWLRRKGRTSQKNYAGVYNAAVNLPKIRAKLIRPPVEMNNLKWLISETEEETVSQEKVYIAQLVMDTVGASPQKVVKMIKSVYGDDYAKIDKVMLGERLGLSSDLLVAADKREKRDGLKDEVLGNLQARLDQVKDHVFDDVQVSEDINQDRAAGKAVAPDMVDSRVYDMINFYKGRSNTRKKMVGLVHRPIDFKTSDYDILAKDFRITPQEAQALVQHLQGCFAQDGSFKKSNFISAIEHFRKYEQKIFAFLWHHMKDAILPKDRVAFLNALQTLTAQMDLPKRAFKILIEDICSDPNSVQFSDNKAVMLANLIVHRPDRVLADYEITPEDIVLNRLNLDEMVVQYAAWRIDKEREQFFTKVETIHAKLAEALCLGQTNEKKIPASVMLNLERELFIFLSMVPCDTGKAILRSAVSEYGAPESSIYHYKESPKFMGGVLQNLRVALRGVGTVGGLQDIAILEAVKEKNEDFQRLKNDRQFRIQAKLVTDWADEAIKIIKFRS